MQKANPHQGEWRSLVSGCVALLVVLADLFSKWWIRSHLEMGQALFDVGFFQIVRISNTGAAFGILKDQTLLISIIGFVGVLVLLIIGFILRHRWPFLESMLAMSAIGLVIGGTIGNLIDRLTHDGRVTDFIDFKVWPVWNVADMAVTVGEVLIVYRLISLAWRAEYHK
jgi:signal peptidase II